MLEDLSAHIRLGVTMSMLALLIVVVLTMMVVSQMTLSNGISALQAEAHQVQGSEFNNYKNKEVSGSEVLFAVDYYGAKGYAIIVRNAKCKNESIHNITDGNTDSNDNKDEIPWAYNYGAVVAGDAQGQKTNAKQALTTNEGTITVYGVWSDPTAHKAGGENIKVLNGFSTNISNGKNDVWLVQEGKNYTTNLLLTNGAVEVNDDTDLTKKKDSNEYILQSGKFKSTLLESSSGNIIGILFEQL